MKKFSLNIKIILGGLIGAGIAYILTKNKYVSVLYLIKHEMSEEQKRKLAEGVRKIVKDVDASDAKTLLRLIKANSNLESSIINEVSQYLQNQLGYATS